MATYPTPAQIDAAVPVDGTPSRALTNAALKAVSAPPTWGQVLDKPATFAPIVGTSATQAKAGNYQPTWAQVTGKPGLLTLASAAPALPDSAGTPNQIFFDTDFLYICIATDTWRQIPLMTWGE